MNFTLIMLILLSFISESAGSPPHYEHAYREQHPSQILDSELFEFSNVIESRKLRDNQICAEKLFYGKLDKQKEFLLARTLTDKEEISQLTVFEYDFQSRLVEEKIYNNLLSIYCSSSSDIQFLSQNFEPSFRRTISYLSDNSFKIAKINDSNGYTIVQSYYLDTLLLMEKAVFYNEDLILSYTYNNQKNKPAKTFCDINTYLLGNQEVI